MSGASKRLHEEGGHQLPSKRPIEENNAISSFPGRLSQAVTNECRQSIDPNSDGRLAKIPRIDSRETSKRSSLPVIRLTSSSNGSCLDPLVQSENRSELRDHKDGRDAKVDTREIKAAEIQSKTRIDPQSSKMETDSRQENRLDGKELKTDRESSLDIKPDKPEKDGSSPINFSSYLNWKETKEFHKSIRYSESPGECLDDSRHDSRPWPGTRHGMHNSGDPGKEILTTEVRDSPGECLNDSSHDARLVPGSRHGMHNSGDPGKNFLTTEVREAPGECPDASRHDARPCPGARHDMHNSGDPGKEFLTTEVRESPGECLDDSWHDARPWPGARHGMHNSSDPGKEILTTEVRESIDTSEAVGENKLDLKGEEKIREKERKRKDEKYRDWVEKEKDKHDRHSNLHPPYATKDFHREDRDSQRWDREWKDSKKEKDTRDRERDIIKKTSNLNERDFTDVTGKVSEKEHTILETRKLRETDSWKSGERENKEKKRDKDQHLENERHDRRNKGFSDKEVDDGYAEGEGISERDKDTVNYGAQRRRILRSRGASQGSHREPRFRSGSRENEGCQEKPEVSSIVYKVGECMQEFLRSWKEYEASQNGKKDGGLQGGPILEIRIPAEHVTSTNRQVKGGQLWGTDIYSDDSDLVAVLMHTGYCRPTSSAQPALVQELRATVRVLPPQDSYASTLRNNVRSRAWGAGISCSFRVEKCCVVKKGGGTIDLEPRLTQMSAMEPTLAPLSAERTMTTRAAASNALRQQRFIREVTIQYNLCNEPWLKYSINVVADKGLKKPQYTSARLKKGEVLYLETHSTRFELCFIGEKLTCNGTAAPVSSALESVHVKSSHHNTHYYTGDRNHDHNNNIKDVFRWSRCKKALPQKVMRTIGIPSPIEHLEVLEENLDWEDLQWSQAGVFVAGKEYTLARVHFLSQT